MGDALRIMISCKFSDMKINKRERDLERIVNKIKHSLVNSFAQTV